MEPLSVEAQNFVHGRYRHYKGNEYQTHFIARIEETGQEVVVYQDVSDPAKVWCRPLTSFLETVEREGQMCPRFQKLF